MTVVSNIAYKATWDARDLMSGLATTRQLFRQQQKILEESRTPLERYHIGQQNLAKLMNRYPELLSQVTQRQDQLYKQYLREESAIRKLTEAERERFKELMTHKEKEAEFVRSRAEATEAIQERFKQASMLNELRSPMVEKYQAQAEEDRYNAWKGKMQAEYKYQHGGEIAPSYHDQIGGEGGSAGSGARLSLRKIGAFVGVAGLGSKAIGFGKELATQGIADYREIERAKATMIAFTGSSESAGRMMAELRKTSDDLGVSFISLAENAKTMMMNNIAPKEATELVKHMTIVTGGSREQMEGMAKALSDVKQKGSLAGQELIQLRNAGFNPFNAMAELTGKSIAQLQKEMSQGSVSFKMLTDSLAHATREGTEYRRVFEELQETTEQSATRSANAWKDASASIGRALKPLTMAYHSASESFAKDFARLADLISGGDSEIVPEAQKGRDWAAESKARVEAERTRTSEALAKREAFRLEQEKKSLNEIAQIQIELHRQSLGEEGSARFSRIWSMLTEESQKRAKTEIEVHGKEADITLFLSKQARAEFEATEELRKKLTLLEKEKNLREEAKNIAKRFRSEEEQQIDALAEIELAKRMGGLSQKNYDRARREVVQDNKGTSSLAANMQVGSQEAYKFIAGVVDRRAQEEMRIHQENKRLNERTARAVEKMEARLSELEPIGVAG